MTGKFSAANGIGPASAVLLLSFLTILGCSSAHGAAVSHGPRQAGEEVLDELLLGRKTLVAKVGSAGCTGKGSFRIEVRKEEGMTPLAPHYVLTIHRVHPDECKAVVGEGPSILWELEKDLGLAGNYTFSVANRVHSDTPPSDWGDEERSMVSVVREHVKPEGAGTAEATPEGSAPAAPGAAPTAGTPPPGHADDYRRIVERLKKGDREVDFTELRMAWTKSKDYVPYGGDESGRRAAIDAMKRKEYAEAARRAGEALEGSYADPELHRICAAAYDRLGDAGKRELHDFVAKGLSDSLHRSGDGSTPAKAFVVTSVAEEDFLLQEGDLRATDSVTVERDGHRYDKVEAEDLYLKINLPRTIWFNIDIPQGWLDRGPE